MTEITGKIYQMKDASGNENRFPRTVIEGVLGLSSYLQNQFSSLADIYMPIGGIYQSQTGQEFVYRATPNTIKAKSFTLDRIQGKTLAWNQLVSDSHRNFVSSITDTKSALQLQIQWYNSSSYINSFNINSSLGLHVIIARAATGSTNCRIKHNGSTTDIDVITAIVLKVTSNHLLLFSYNTKEADPTTVGGIKIDDICVFDLTLLYGSDIDGMTDAEILAKFESEYPGYHDHSAGKLISNDAESIETVGFNQWDEVAESGYYDVTTGQKVDAQEYTRCKNFIPVFPSTQYYVKGTNFRILFYDASHNLISYQTEVTNTTVTTPAKAKYITFYSQNANVVVGEVCINLSDATRNGQYEPYRKSVLPLNLDDFWVKDGQGNQVHITGGLKSAGSVYDEIVGNKYIKRVGVYTFTGNEVWTLNGSYQGVCNVNLPRKLSSDYWSQKANIIHEKYATGPQNKMYSGEDLDTIGACDSTSSGRIVCGKNVYDNMASLTGTKLYFELATPIEYDLVEPLIYTMKAGTTEARISPNEDGLSAPFCCDMTYSASDNNDADNAQYAATAGRLLNTHTILGQSFNGTQDIGGAISDVSSIDGAIHFDITNPSSPLVGISTTSPTVRLDVNGEIKGSRLHSTVANGTAPLTVVSSTLVTNLNAEKVGGCTVEQITAPLAEGIASNASRIQSLEDWLVNPSLDELTADELNVIESLRVGKGIFVWDSTNNALRFKGNFYADGFVSAYGTNESEALEALKAWVTENFEPKQS